MTLKLAVSSGAQKFLRFQWNLLCR